MARQPIYLFVFASSKYNDLECIKENINNIYVGTLGIHSYFLATTTNSNIKKWLAKCNSSWKVRNFWFKFGKWSELEEIIQKCTDITVFKTYDDKKCQKVIELGKKYNKKINIYLRPNT